jgi:quercetin dioxygenase-like cupin family protein
MSEASYTIVNMMELDDLAAGRGTGTEARFARSHLDSDHLGVSHFRFEPGVRSPFAHNHREQEEAYIVISGGGRMRLDDEVKAVRAWDVIRVSPSTIRAFEAGDDGLELVAIGSDRPEGGDGTPIEQVWIEE